MPTGSRRRGRARRKALAAGSRPPELDDILQRARPFRTLGGQLFATVSVDGRWETYPIASDSLRSWVRRTYREVVRYPMPRALLAAALDELRDEAEFNGQVQPVALRVARVGSRLYVDLADRTGRAVEIRAEGWRLVDDPGIAFLRPRRMLPLPVPTPGGSIDLLRQFVHLNDDAFTLLVGAVLAAYMPSPPYFVLVLFGEQGGGKTTLARVIRALVDPNESAVRAAPRDQPDLLVAAAHERLVVFDNMPVLPAQLSDALCRLSTGGGFSTRRLYTDGEEFVMDAARPVVINGIAQTVVRDDLADRSISIEVPAIAEASRRTEASLWAAFDQVRPAILGAIFDALAVALAGVDDVALDVLPRMADATRWVTAAEPALGWPSGTFAAAYANNRRNGLAQQREESALTAAVTALVADGPWSGRSSALLGRLSSFAPAWARADPDWPRTPRALVAQLQRQSPALRDAGIVWGRRRTAEERLIDIWTVPRSAGPTGTPTGRPDD